MEREKEKENRIWHVIKFTTRKSASKSQTIAGNETSEVLA